MSTSRIYFPPIAYRTNSLSCDRVFQSEGAGKIMYDVPMVQCNNAIAIYSMPSKAAADIPSTMPGYKPVF